MPFSLLSRRFLFLKKRSHPFFLDWSPSPVGVGRNSLHEAEPWWLCSFKQLPSGLSQTASFRCLAGPCCGAGPAPSEVGFTSRGLSYGGRYMRTAHLLTSCMYIGWALLYTASSGTPFFLQSHQLPWIIIKDVILFSGAAPPEPH